MTAEHKISAQLRDIKPLMEIPDSSYYIYWGLICFAALVSVILIFLISRKLWKMWKNRKVNLAKGYLEAIKKIDWVESKQSAYEATHYARLLATDEKRKVLFDTLEPRLEQYKYKKEVGKIDQETQKLFDEYVQVADESV